ncbi:WD40/YVTN/BNR-like repeat-containing protein [Haloarchaeobius sp. TZWWS8]|uniref:WD40/YVTN/BNR-like repeat-containing protein n=1 Tax=Haloarchaeobius sp. TZWWS8 TaxID=3446121 RepID=UPI003EBA022A
MEAPPSCRVYVGTDDGLFVLDVADDGVDRVGRSLAGETVREVSVHPEDPAVAMVGCGLRGSGLHRTTRAGDRARQVGFGDEWVWGVTRDPTDPDAVFVGTEPPGLYYGRPGEGFEQVADLDGLPSRDDWSFGHDPFQAGHVHGVSVEGETVVAAVEQGAVVFSTDGGETWDDALPGVDAHDTAIVDGRALVTAGTANGSTGGLYWAELSDLSDWHTLSRFEEMCVEELVRGIDGRLYFDGMHETGETDTGIWSSDDGGRTWTSAGVIPPTDVDGCNCLDTHPESKCVLFHSTQRAYDWRLVVSPDRGATWEEIGPTLPRIRTVDAVSLP